MSGVGGNTRATQSKHSKTEAKTSGSSTTQVSSFNRTRGTIRFSGTCAVCKEDKDSKVALHNLKRKCGWHTCPNIQDVRQMHILNIMVLWLSIARLFIESSPSRDVSEILSFICNSHTLLGQQFWFPKIRPFL
jgi:hypothetical protein